MASEFDAAGMSIYEEKTKESEMTYAYDNEVWLVVLHPVTNDLHEFERMHESRLQETIEAYEGEFASRGFVWNCITVILADGTPVSPFLKLLKLPSYRQELATRKTWSEPPK